MAIFCGAATEAEVPRQGSFRTHQDLARRGHERWLPAFGRDRAQRGSGSHSLVWPCGCLFLALRHQRSCCRGLQRRALRRTAVEMGLAAAVQPAEKQEATVAAAGDEEAGKVRRLLGDPEVKLIRQLQDRLQLYDGQRMVPLSSCLQPGKPLYDADVVCIGEIHDSEADHALQRLIIDALTYSLFLALRSSEGVDPAAPTGRTPQNLSPQRLAVGVEYFTRQQQQTLDQLIFDRSEGGPGSSPSKFREACDWDRQWNYDWEIYAPLFRFCQLNLNRVVGLNIPLEATLMVSKGGVASTPSWLQSRLPDLDLSQPRHRRRFEDMLRMPLEEAVQRMSSPIADWKAQEKLNSTYEAQVLWDEYMASTALNYVNDVGGRLVVLAGTNHVWRDAIPDRFERQSRGTASGKMKKRAVSVVPWRGKQLPPSGLSDYVLCMDGAGGGSEIAAELKSQRDRLKGQSRVFPAGYI